jgi:hypothetical protein
MVTFKGETRPILEWSAILGIPHATLSGRLKKGWSPEKAFTTQIGTCHRPKNLLITLNGVTHTIKEWSEISGLSLGLLRMRARMGYPLDRFLAPRRNIGR